MRLRDGRQPAATSKEVRTTGFDDGKPGFSRLRFSARRRKNICGAINLFPRNVRRIFSIETREHSAVAKQGPTAWRALSRNPIDLFGDGLDPRAGSPQLGGDRSDQPFMRDCGLPQPLEFLGNDIQSLRTVLAFQSLQDPIHNGSTGVQAGVLLHIGMDHSWRRSFAVGFAQADPACTKGADSATGLAVIAFFVATFANWICHTGCSGDSSFSEEIGTFTALDQSISGPGDFFSSARCFFRSSFSCLFCRRDCSFWRLVNVDLPAGMSLRGYIQYWWTRLRHPGNNEAGVDAMIPRPQYRY